MSKKTFYIILIVLAGILVIGGFVWFFFSKSATPPTTPEGPGFTTPDKKGAERWQPIGESPTVSAHFSGNDIVFSDFSGQLWRLAEGEIKPSLITQAEVSSSTKPIPRTIKNLPLADVIFKWVKPNQIIAVSKPSGLVPGNLWTIDAVSARIAKLINDIPGLEVLFAPNGEDFLYSSVSQGDLNPILTIVKKGVAKDIDNFATLVDKCAWAKDSINLFCAVPLSWSEAVVLPDDYHKSVFATMDNLWSINAETGEKNILIQNVGDINNLETNTDDGVLIFISRDTGFLYKFNLK